MSTQVLVCCGVGGVGKTTTAAALALGRALAGDRVVVLTIDPARRLADALGITLEGVDLAEVDLSPLGYRGPGRLDATMLDRKAMFDRVIGRFAPDADTATRVVANRYYRAVSERLGGSQEFMAMERLYELVESGSWDIVVVDTPPARHALDFFRAPERVRRVFDRSVLEILVRPSRGLFAGTTRRVARLLRRLAGEHVLDDISEFFGLLGGMSAGFRERSAVVHDLLRSKDTRYLLVTSASAPARTDVLEFLSDLHAHDMKLDGFIVNRVVPFPAAASELGQPWPDPPPGVDPEGWAHWGEALRGLTAHVVEASTRHREAITALHAHAPGAAIWTVPDQPAGVQTLGTLTELAAHLPPRGQRVF